MYMQIMLFVKMLACKCRAEDVYSYSRTSNKGSSEKGTLYIRPPYSY